MLKLDFLRKAGEIKGLLGGVHPVRRTCLRAGMHRQASNSTDCRGDCAKRPFMDGDWQSRETEAERTGYYLTEFKERKAWQKPNKCSLFSF